LKRTTQLVAIAAALTLLVGAACSKSATPGATGSSPAACKSPTGGKTVTIGLIGDLTGSNSALVVPGKNAAQLAFDQANCKGNLKVSITFKPLDNKEANPTTAPALAQQLISDATVIGVIGPAFSGETSAVQPLFKQAGLTHITQSATRADLTTKGYNTFFRSVGGDTDQAAAAARYAVKGPKACKNVAVIDDKSAYGQGYGDIAAKNVKTEGGSVVVRQGVSPATDYTSLVDTLTTKNPDCVIYGGYEPQASIIVKQMREKGVKALFISGDGSKSTKFIPDAGAANAEGVIFTCPCLDANVSTDAAAVQFVSDFKAKFSVAPDIYAPEAYDDANIFIHAIEACGDNVTRACVLDQVTSLKDFKGLTKTFNWTTDPKLLHEVTDKGVNVYEVKGGAITLSGNINEVVPA
jgi:branched-chain amino acid transport system substrate-binding protein